MDQGPKKRKKALLGIRRHLKMADDIQNSYIEGQGDPKDYPLIRLFGGPENKVKKMLGICDEILGTKEPIRYPRQKIILETLRIWAKYNGKAPSLRAVGYDPHSETRTETAPYALCRAMLTSIEGKDPGDFHGMYETIVKKHFPRK